MIINDKIINIPPYISTSWEHVSALHMKSNLLIITLTDGDSIGIPNLKTEIIEQIFQAHVRYLENSLSEQKEPKLEDLAKEKLFSSLGLDNKDPIIGIPFQLGLSSNDKPPTGILQHNPAQSDTPKLPEAVLNKISTIIKILAPEDSNVLPKAEPHCNCVYCQIARAVNPSFQDIESHEEHITDEDLKFEQWEISQAGDKLYTVANKLDKLEIYNVYLGEPIGCTCGKTGCEHVLAVLKS